MGEGHIAQLMTKLSEQFYKVPNITSAAISVFLTGIIIIAHDISGELRQSLTGLTGHHWTSVSLISLALFVLISIILCALHPERS